MKTVFIGEKEYFLDEVAPNLTEEELMEVINRLRLLLPTYLRDTL